MLYSPNLSKPALRPRVPATIDEMAARVKREGARHMAEARPTGATRRFDHWEMAHHWWLARRCGPDVRRVPDWTAAALHAYWAAACLGRIRGAAVGAGAGAVAGRMQGSVGRSLQAGNQLSLNIPSLHQASNLDLNQ
jgi:hypothetical protein